MVVVRGSQVLAPVPGGLTRAQVESLAWDIDYRSKITRADFEIACKDLKGEYARPIFDALASAGMTLVCARSSGK